MGSSISLKEDCEEVGIKVALRPIAAKLLRALLSSSDPSASSGTSAFGLWDRLKGLPSGIPDESSCVSLKVERLSVLLMRFCRFGEVIVSSMFLFSEPLEYLELTVPALLSRCFSISLTRSSAFIRSIVFAGDEEEEDRVAGSGSLANANAFNRNSESIRKCSSSSALSASVFFFNTSENRFRRLPLVEDLLLSLMTLSCSEAEADSELFDKEALELACDALSPARDEACDPGRDDCLRRPESIFDRLGTLGDVGKVERPNASSDDIP